MRVEGSPRDSDLEPRPREFRGPRTSVSKPAAASVRYERGQNLKTCIYETEGVKRVSSQWKELAGSIEIQTRDRHPFLSL